MSVSIKGLDSLMNKLNKLSNVKGKEAVESVASAVETSIRASAFTFSSSAYQYIGQCEKREYKNGSYFIEIGLKNDNAPFDLWKNLWYHNWGYNLWLFGKPTDRFLGMHINWFANSINQIEGPTIQKMRSILIKQIKVCLEE